MALSYRVWSQEEDDLRGTIEKGIYQFIVRAVEKKLTKKGTYEMLVVDLIIIDNNGQKRGIKDWIVLMDEMGWKLRHFAIACGMLEAYNNESILPGDFLNKDGAVEIGINELKDENGEKTGKKGNFVIDYIAPVEVVKDQFKDDDIKF